MNNLYDICESRHRGNPLSQEAFGRIAPVLHDKQQQVLALIRSAGLHGATAKEVARALGKALNAVSGRCSELKAMGLVGDSGRRREASAVLVCVESMFQG